MAVRIPVDARSDQAKPMRRVVEETARKLQTTGGYVELIMIHVFTALVAEVARGNVVNVPGFGIFGSKLWQPGKRGGLPHALPAFVASRDFRQEVRYSLWPEKVKSLRKIRKRHACGGVPRKENRRSFWTLHRMRLRLLRKGTIEKD